MADSMAVYRDAVVTWAREHPEFEGPVDREGPAAASWWRLPPGMKAVVSGRLVVVYVEAPLAAGLAAAVQRNAGGSLLVGEASGGTLRSPAGGDTGIKLPPEVPDGAAVWLATRD